MQTCVSGELFCFLNLFMDHFPLTVFLSHLNIFSSFSSECPSGIPVGPRSPWAHSYLTLQFLSICHVLSSSSTSNPQRIMANGGNHTKTIAKANVNSSR